MNDKYIIDGVEYDNLEDMFASRIHDVWSHWQKYLHSKLKYTEQDGVAFYILDADLYERWSRQIDSTYKELSDEERKSDMNIYNQFYKQIIDNLTTESLSGRKAKLTFPDGTEYSVVVE